MADAPKRSFNVDADISRVAGDLNFGLNINLCPFFASVRSKVTWETKGMPRFT